MPPGIFEGSPWLGDVEFTRMPLDNIPRIPSQIHQTDRSLRLTVSDCAWSYIRLIAAITASVAASLIRECIGSCTHSAAAASVTGRCAPIDRYGASKCDAMTPR